MLVYRIESTEDIDPKCKHNVGPFQSRTNSGPAIDAYVSAMEDGDDLRRMPTPCEEHLFVSYEYVYGFRSMGALLRIFSCQRGREALKKKGMVLSVYESSSVEKAPKQCAFLPRTAELVERYDLETLDLIHVESVTVYTDTD